MGVSVIVSNFNGAKYLPKLLATLKAQRGVESEIIVVDRNSTDESAAILAQYPDVRVISEPPESGLVCGYAAGVASARHEHLFFCNEDMWFDPSCLAELEKQISLASGVAAADPWQWTYGAEHWIHGGTRFVRTRFTFGVYPFRRTEPTVRLADGEDTAFCNAGAMLIHRKVYEEIGGWDRSFFLDEEDVDLFLRFWLAGWRCVSVSAAKVYHAVGISNQKVLNQGRLLVSKRRYISDRANCLIIGVKYFSTYLVLLQVFSSFLLPVVHACKLRGRQSWWDFLGIVEFCRRLPDALDARRKCRESKGCRRGEHFFTDWRFQKH